MTVTNYIWDVENDTCLMETDENGETKVVYSHEPTQFGGLISQRREGQTYYHHYDALGSTRQLTDADENVTDEYVYTAWGEPVVASGTTENPYRWVGRWGYYWDAGTDTYYVRRRDYQPRVARWLSVDPLGFAESMNRFFYGTNRPLGHVDPDGMLCFRYDEGAFDTRVCSPTGIVYRWPVEWELSPDETNGFIVQRIYRSTFIIDCKGDRAQITRKFAAAFKEGAPPEEYTTFDAFSIIEFPEKLQPEWQGYWELWPVKDGKVYIGKPPHIREPALTRDVIGLKVDIDSCGYDGVVAEAFFLPTKIAEGAEWPEPPKGWDAWVVFGPDFPTADLAAKRTPDRFVPLDPKRHGFAQLLRRRIISYWCCCDCSLAFTMKFGEVGRCP